MNIQIILNESHLPIRDLIYAVAKDKNFPVGVQCSVLVNKQGLLSFPDNPEERNAIVRKVEWKQFWDEQDAAVVKLFTGLQITKVEAETSFILHTNKGVINLGNIDAHTIMLDGQLVFEPRD